MNDHKIKSLDQIRRFLSGAIHVEFKPCSKKECYTWIQDVLKRFGYHQLSRCDKGCVFAYLAKLSGYSRQQISRLIEQHRKTRKIRLSEYKREKFPTIYLKEDILLLAEVDELHQIRSGAATKKTFERMYSVFGEQRYKRLSGISIAHIYNLRRTHFYRERYQVYTKTKSTKVMIGERRKPQPNGIPGYLRVDSVHQGDLDKVNTSVRFI